jgi:hypothetical protein
LRTGAFAAALIFPGLGKSFIFPRVRLAGAGLWRAISGISVLWARVSGAGLCSPFSNFRFGGAKTGSPDFSPCEPSLRAAPLVFTQSDGIFLYRNVPSRHGVYPANLGFEFWEDHMLH